MGATGCNVGANIVLGLFSIQAIGVLVVGGIAAICIGN